MKTESCGIATIRLLSRYGVDTVFGIPGVHTLEFCRGLAESPIRHVQARNEQGAGFMADGFARASGRPGVALVISGPGVTNAATPLGQSYADSVPVLLLSSEAASRTIGKGWGMLHEVTQQKAVTAPLTALSATAMSPSDVPDLLAQAFSIFASERPRPVHISIPIDVLAQPVSGLWEPVRLPDRPAPAPAAIGRAAAVLAQALRPVMLVGGGAAGCGPALALLAERIGAVVIASTAGKGIVPDSHPQSLGAATVRPEAQRLLADADVIVAVGTEIAETDSFVERLDMPGRLIRIDIDPRKMNDLYPAEVAIVADAAAAVAALLEACSDAPVPIREAARASVTRITGEIAANMTVSERAHQRLLEALRQAAPEDTVFAGDICQLVYTGAFAMPVLAPRLWHYPAGFCTLGCGLPNGIGAKLALPERPVIVLSGDGGVMFTVQELVTAAELGLPLPIIVWDNGGYKQIADDMRSRDIPLVGVQGVNPDFNMLATACGCLSAAPASAREFEAAVTAALAADRPTVIVVREGQGWLA